MILLRIFQTPASFLWPGFSLCHAQLKALQLDRAGRLERFKHKMTDLTVIYWRDIPAQVRVGRGRRAARAVLSERFEQAIDRVAMKIGATEGDAYMAEWRDVIETCEGDPQTAADARALALETDYDKTRLIALVNNDGREPS